jgi:hypothetical protein
MAYDQDEGPVHASGGVTEAARRGPKPTMEPGGVKGFPPAIKKGYSARSNGYDANNGPAEMWEGESRGNGAFDFKDVGERTGFSSSGAPVWLDGNSSDMDAVNAKGSLASVCKSDSMFDKFKHEEISWDYEANRTNSSTNSSDKVSSGGFPSDDSGTKADPAYEHMPAEQQKGSGQDYTGNRG